MSKGVESPQVYGEGRKKGKLKVARGACFTIDLSLRNWIISLQGGFFLLFYPLFFSVRVCADDLITLVLLPCSGLHSWWRVIDPDLDLWFRCDL